MAAQPQPGQRVLLVDDNIDAAELLAEALRHAGHQVVVAHDGPSALVLAKTFAASACVLDIGLPVMDGHELSEKLHVQYRGAVVKWIALTGYGLSADRERSHDAGFDVHLVKPIDLKKLLELLAK